MNKPKTAEQIIYKINKYLTRQFIIDPKYLPDEEIEERVNFCKEPFKNP